MRRNGPGSGGRGAPALGLDAVVAAAPGQVSCEVGGEAVILSLADSTYYGLDEVGALVWARLQAPAPVRALVDAVVAEYEVAPEVCARDVLALLGELVARGLVRVAPPGAGA